MTPTAIIRRRSFPMLCALLLLALPASALAGDVSGLVVFGDSLSDPGNHFVAFGTIALQPYLPIPDDSYAIGGHHFSDGATWAEQLATALGVPNGGGPALREPGVFTNYAVGRARARANAPVFPYFDLTTQVGRFLADAGGVASPTDLYVIWIGGNDLQDALSALAADPTGATSVGILQEAVQSVGANVVALWSSGARRFLLPRAPDLAVTPAVRAAGLEAPMSFLASAYNDGLDQLVAALTAQLGIEVTRFDVNPVFKAVQDAPALAGFANATDPCLTFFVVGEAMCSTPNRYLFWDGIHPTTVGHGIIAVLARQAIGAP